MDPAQILLLVLWVGVTCYALLGGADFGGGIWDLLAGRSRTGMPERNLIENSIGPVWEANHVWLIFVLVMLWTGFSPVFAAIMSTLYIPLTLVAFGIIARGAAFAFRKASPRLWQKRLFGGAFALSSVLTPFFLGTVAGGVASGRVPAGLAAGDIVTGWLNPTSILGGVLAVGVCAYLAAIYLCDDTVRAEMSHLTESYRTKALITGLCVGAVALVGIAVLRADAPRLFEGLTHRALPLVIASAVFGLLSLILLWSRNFTLVRITGALAVTAVLWGWPLAQYPLMLPPSLTVSEAAAHPAVLTATLISLAVGTLLLVPSLALMFLLQRRWPYRSDTPG